MPRSLTKRQIVGEVIGFGSGSRSLLPRCRTARLPGGLRIGIIPALATDALHIVCANLRDGPFDTISVGVLAGADLPLYEELVALVYVVLDELCGLAPYLDGVPLRDFLLLAVAVLVPFTGREGDGCDLPVFEGADVGFRPNIP